MTWWLIFYTFLFLLGFGLSYIAYTEFQKTKALLAKGIQTTALVREYVVSRGESNNMYQPVFEYKDHNQKVHTYTSTIKSYPPAHKIGEKVKIVYSRKNVNKVKTISFWGLYRGSVILFMIASPLLVIGGAYLMYRLY